MSIGRWPGPRFAHRVRHAGVPLAALAALAGCAHQPPAAATTPAALVTPGQRGWTNPASADTTLQYRLTLRKAPGAAEQEYGVMTQGEFRTTESGVAALMLVQGLASAGWSDTLIMRRATLAPQRETLHLGRRVIRLTYDGARVTRFDQTADSAAHTSTVDFPSPVFAFNQLDLLVRAAPLRVGYQAILPLYSEITAELEHDTLAVLAAPAAASARPLWTLRFADPAIVVTYTVDAATRQIVDYESTFRKTGGGLRRIPVGAPAPPAR